MINRKDIEEFKLVKCKKTFNSSMRVKSYISEKIASAFNGIPYISIKSDININSKIANFIAENCNIKDVFFEKDKIYKVDKLEYCDMSLSRIYINKIKFFTSGHSTNLDLPIDQFFETITLAELREIRINKILE
jgi:hypothetical protein